MKPLNMYFFSFLYFLFVTKGGRRILKFALIPYIAIELYCRFRLLGHWVGWTDLYSVTCEDARDTWNWLSDGGKSNSSAIGSLIAAIGLIGLYLNIRHNRNTRQRELATYQANLTPVILTRVYQDARKGEEVFTLSNVGGGPAIDLHFTLFEIDRSDPTPKTTDDWQVRYSEYVPLLEKSGATHKYFVLPILPYRREVRLGVSYADSLGKYYRAHQFAGANPGDPITTGNFVVEKVKNLDSLTFREKLLHLFVYETSKAVWRVGETLKAWNIHSFSKLIITLIAVLIIARRQRREEEEEEAQPKEQKQGGDR